MRLNGEGKVQGLWAQNRGIMTCKESEEEVVWLTGEKVKPWVYTIEFNHVVCPKFICYKYSIYDKQTQLTVWEREPSRYVDLEDPNNYKGHLVETGGQQQNISKVFIVNGHIEKADANFVGNMTFDKIGDTHIYLGQYPQTEADINLLSQEGIDGVFNVQTFYDFKCRAVDWPKMLEWY